MGKSKYKVLSPLNIAQLEKGSFEALLVEAHQYLVTGILMRLGFLVSVITVRGGTFDLVIPAYENHVIDRARRVLIRAQVRTIGKKGGLSLLGGRRAGRGMIVLEAYKRGYKYTPEHNDLIIGVDRETLDLYLAPTRYLAMWGRSISKGRLGPLKNKFDILLNWNDAYLADLAKELKT
jgi:hypothetical protein